MYLTQALHRALQRHPAKVALRHVGADASRDYTFERFVSEIARQAAALHARGVRVGDRVAMLSPNNDALVVQLLRVLVARRCRLPAERALERGRAALRAERLRRARCWWPTLRCTRRSELQDVTHRAARADAGRAARTTLRRSKTRAPAATRWPPSSTPAAPPAARRA